MPAFLPDVAAPERGLTGPHRGSRFGAAFSRPAVVLKAQQRQSASPNDLIGLSAVEGLLAIGCLAHDDNVERNTNMVDFAIYIRKGASFVDQFSGNRGFDAKRNRLEVRREHDIIVACALVDRLPRNGGGGIDPADDIG